MRHLILSFLLASCGPKQGGIDVASSLTSSPCFDGAMINIENVCKNIHSNRVPGFNVVRVNCLDESSTSEWASNTFYFVGNDFHFHKHGWIHLCSDPAIDVYFIKTHITAPSLKDEASK